MKLRIVFAVPALATSLCFAQTREEVLAGLEARAKKVTSYSAQISERLKRSDDSIVDSEYRWQWSDGKYAMHFRAKGTQPEHKDLSTGTEFLTFFRMKESDAWEGIVNFAPLGPNSMVMGMFDGLVSYRGRDLVHLFHGMPLKIETVEASSEWGVHVKLQGSTEDREFSMLLLPERDWACSGSVWTSKDGKLRESYTAGDLVKVNGAWVPNSVTKTKMRKEGKGWKILENADRVAMNIKVGEQFSDEFDFAKHYLGVKLYESGTSNEFVIAKDGKIKKTGD